MADDNKVELNSEPDIKKDEDEQEGMKVDSEDDGETEESGSPEENDSQKGRDEKKAPETATKKKITNWPMREIKEPSPNDVLFGRGGGTNHHPGNKRYRKMVEDRKLDYVNCKRLDKPLVALDIIREWRGQDPPGRFLKLDEKTGLWQDVGDKKAREKTSQALREKAPLIRKQQEDELKAKGDGDKSVDSQDDEPEPEPITKTTRFAEGTNEEKKGVKKAVLARDHSLGREYLQVGEAVSLDGFSWQDPIETDERVTSHGSLPPPPPSHSFPSGRTGSHGSIGVPPPEYRIQSHGSIGGLSPAPPPPPPPDFYGRMSSGDYLRTYSSGHFESWGPVSSFGSANMPPPPPLPGYPGHHGSWTQHEACMSREHSLSGNHLRDASISHPAPPTAFDSRTSSGYWGDPSVAPHGPPPPPHHGPPNHYSPRDGPPTFRPNHVVGRSYGHSPPSGPAYHRPNGMNPPSPPYDVDPVIAKTWSGGQELKTSGSFESYGRPTYDPPNSVPHRSYEEAVEDSELPRPCIVKRATSNQNETLETKKDLKGPSVKRAALNRDNSLASNRLKEKYVPGYQDRKVKGTFDPEREMNILSDNLEQSTLSTPGSTQPRPQPLRPEERISTLDHIAMDLMTRPMPVTESSRSSTIEALALEFADDPMLDRVALERSSTSDSFSALLRDGLPRPSCLTSDSRLSTMDFLQIINEPLEEEVDEYLDKPLDFKSESSGATGECFTSV